MWVLEFKAFEMLFYTIGIMVICLRQVEFLTTVCTIHNVVYIIMCARRIRIRPLSSADFTLLSWGLHIIIRV